MKLIKDMIKEERTTKFRIWQEDQNLKKDILDLLNDNDFDNSFIETMGLYGNLWAQAYKKRIKFSDYPAEDRHNDVVIDNMHSMPSIRLIFDGLKQFYSKRIVFMQSKYGCNYRRMI